MTPLAEIVDSFFKPAVRDLVPYEPGKPVEEVQRELGLERVVKLASNEGPFGPFPEALDALARLAPELNRYPDGGSYRLRAALAERHDVRFEEIAPGAGSDGVVDYLSQLALDPGDEIVCGWPSFPSYAIDALKLGAVARRVPLREHRYDLGSMLEAVGPKTKLVYVCHPNNPTGTMNTRAELDDYFDRVPDHVLTVLDQAYAEYIDHPDYADGVETYLKAGRQGRGAADVLEDLRAGGPARRLRGGLRGGRHGDRQGAPGLRRQLGRAGGCAGEHGGRRGARAPPARERGRVSRNWRGSCASTGSIPLGPRWGTSSSPRSVTMRGRLFEQLLQEGVIVRPAGGFGAPGAIRVTVGTPEENEFFGEALGRVLSGAARS